MIACPVKSSEGGLPKAAFNRVKLMIVDCRGKILGRSVFFLPSHLLIFLPSVLCLGHWPLKAVKNLK
jgi:hypothetical protein